MIYPTSAHEAACDACTTVFVFKDHSDDPITSVFPTVEALRGRLDYENWTIEEDGTITCASCLCQQEGHQFGDLGWCDWCYFDPIEDRTFSVTRGHQ